VLTIQNWARSQHPQKRRDRRRQGCVAPRDLHL